MDDDAASHTRRGEQLSAWCRYLIHGLHSFFTPGTVTIEPVSLTPGSAQTGVVQRKRRNLPFKRFNLLRSFALLSLLSIALISSASAVVLLRFLAGHMLERDAVVTMEFIQSIAHTEEREHPFSRSDLLSNEEALGELFEHIGEMPDVVRANVYATDRSIVWSTDEDLIGRRFDVNPELQHALSGQLVYEVVDRSKGKQAEHAYFSDNVTEFVENYIPIWNRDRSNVVAVAEVYKVPRALFQALEKGRWLVWISAIVGGFFLYVTLFWVVRRGSGVIRTQQERLVESETMVAIGEMASAVAHGIRNPLASIRSRAELAAEDSAGVGHEAAEDITKEVDHLEQWVRELLLFSRAEGSDLELLAIPEVIRDSLNGFSRTMENQAVQLVLHVEEPTPRIRGDPALLGQMLNSLIANALEAMPNGGTLTVGVLIASKSDHVNLTIADTGPGIPEDRLDEVFKPFVTSRRSGLGLGLPLAKRIVERHGGEIALSSHQGRGTTISLRFPKVSD